MTMTFQRETEIREQVKTRRLHIGGVDSLYEKLTELLADIDYLRDSFLDMNVVREAVEKERDRWNKEANLNMNENIQLREKLAVAYKTLDTIYPSLPSYLGESETPELPCLRRLCDEALSKIRGEK